MMPKVAEITDRPLLAAEIHAALRRAAPGANWLLRELEAAERRAARLRDLVLRETRMERNTRGLRERVLLARQMEEARRPRLG